MIAIADWIKDSMENNSSKTVVLPSSIAWIYAINQMFLILIFLFVVMKLQNHVVILSEKITWCEQQLIALDQKREATYHKRIVEGD